MEKQNNKGDSKAARGGDTGRTSSQGRKLASGGNSEKRGDPAMDESTKSPKKQAKKDNNSSGR